MPLSHVLCARLNLASQAESQRSTCRCQSHHLTQPHGHPCRPIIGCAISHHHIRREWGARAPARPSTSDNRSLWRNGHSPSSSRSSASLFHRLSPARFGVRCRQSRPRCTLDLELQSRGSRQLRAKHVVPALWRSKRLGFNAGGALCASMLRTHTRGLQSAQEGHP